MGARMSVVALALAASALGCGVAVKSIGDACSSQEECPGGRAGPGFCSYLVPFGYCTRRCVTDADCDARSFCTLNAGSLICVRQCVTNADCRVADGYACIGVGTDGRKYCYIQ
jgi:hypothetical protein